MQMEAGPMESHDDPYDASAILADVQVPEGQAAVGMWCRASCLAQGLIFQLKDVRFTHPEKWKRPPAEAPVDKADKAGALLRALYRAFGMTTMEAGCRVPIVDFAGNRIFTLVRSGGSRHAVL
jgi:hypothetical protein